MRLISFKIFKENCNNYYDIAYSEVTHKFEDGDFCDNAWHPKEEMLCCKKDCPVFSKLKKERE